MLCLIIPCQDTFDDEEMTSEKLLQLENQKKKAKELQVQAMKDREEAELTVKIFLMKIIFNVQLYFCSEKRKTNKVLNQVEEVETFSMLMTLKLISTWQR